MSENPLRAFGALAGLVAVHSVLGALKLVESALEAASRPAEPRAPGASESRPDPTETSSAPGRPIPAESAAPADLPSRDAVEKALTSMAASSGARRERVARDLSGKGPRKASARRRDRRDAAPPPA